MYGANKNKPEVRAPAIKGQLRWCWRAAKASKNNKELLDSENKIFGSTDYKSAVQITLKTISAKLNANTNSLGKPGSGKGYLYYTQLMQVNKLKRDGITKCFFEPGTKFRLSIMAAEKNKFEQVLAAFWLLIHLNGIGSRSRRTAGNLNVLRVDGGTDILNFLTNFSTVDQFQSFLQQNLAKIKGIILSQNGNNYSVLNNGEIKIVSQGFSKWDDAVEYIGKKIQLFRNRKDPDYNTIKDFLRTGRMSPNHDVERIDFGLPYSGQYRSLEGKKYRVKSCLNEITRRSSPLILKVWKLGNLYCTGCVKLGGTFLPSDRFTLDEIKGHHRSQFHHQNTGIIDDFMNNHLGQTVGIKL